MPKTNSTLTKKIGYGRVSTTDQNLASQADALEAAGCNPIFLEQASGKNSDRPEWQKCLKKLKPGDTLVILRLDRAGRSLKDLIALGDELRERQISLVSLGEGIDTSTAIGVLFFHLLGSLAQFERENMLERTHRGLTAAKARGRSGGRPAKFCEKQKSAIVSQAEEKSLRELADLFNCSRRTIGRVLAKNNT
jgi:DNA invertase Pin-like site-specific DNA recombinase